MACNWDSRRLNFDGQWHLYSSLQLSFPALQEVQAEKRFLEIQVSWYYYLFVPLCMCHLCLTIIPSPFRMYEPVKPLEYKLYLSRLSLKLRSKYDSRLSPYQWKMNLLPLGKFLLRIQNAMEIKSRISQEMGSRVSLSALIHRTRSQCSFVWVALEWLCGWTPWPTRRRSLELASAFLRLDIWAVTI